MNIAFDGHVKMLDLRWNVYPQRMNSEYHIEHAPEKSVEIWKEKSFRAIFDSLCSCSKTVGLSNGRIWTYSSGLCTEIYLL